MGSSGPSSTGVSGVPVAFGRSTPLFTIHDFRSNREIEMLIAELRKKLFNIEELDPEDPESIVNLKNLLKETKEDLLTADVFGAIKYLPRVPYLESVLTEIANRNRGSIAYIKGLPKIISEIHQLKFTFWPIFPTREGLTGSATEPDVEISGPGTLMLFESKLHSAFGEQQVERELAVAMEQGKGKEFFLVLVTPSASLPRFPMDGKNLPFIEYIQYMFKLPHDLEALGKELVANLDRVLWISWQGIMSALESARKRHALILSDRQNEITCALDMLDDLWELMDMRGIRQFKGISSVQPINEDLQSQSVLGIHTSRRNKIEFFPNITGLLRTVSRNPSWEKINCRTRGQRIFQEIREETKSRFLGFSKRCSLLDETIISEKNRRGWNQSPIDIKAEASIKTVDKTRNRAILRIRSRKTLSIASSRKFNGFLQILGRRFESWEMQCRPAGTQIINGIRIRRRKIFRSILEICENYDLNLFRRRIKLSWIRSKKELKYEY